MENLTCRKCCGELIEKNGGFYCLCCGAEYAFENGGLRLLECETCGGNLIDCGDCYKCDLCGKRYEKASDANETAEEEEDFTWLKKFKSDYVRAFAVKNPEDIITHAKALESSAKEALILIGEIESEETRTDGFFLICAKFFGAMRFLLKKIYEDEPSRSYKMKENTVDEMIKSLGSFTRTMEKHKFREQARNEIEYLCACFLTEIYKNTGDEIYTKLVSERAAGIFTGSLEMDDFEEYCPNIAEVIKFCESKMETEQEDLTEAYWQDHFEEYDDLNSEKALLEKERERFAREEKRAITEENKKVEAAKKEYNDAEQKCYELIAKKAGLKFFQKKKKEMLYNESLVLNAKREELEKKMNSIAAQTEENIDRIQTEYSEKEVELSEKIFEIKRELERNRYPGEEIFAELFEREIKNAEK